jgi:hypothetical protein
MLLAHPTLGRWGADGLFGHLMVKLLAPWRIYEGLLGY